MIVITFNKLSQYSVCHGLVSGSPMRARIDTYFSVHLGWEQVYANDNDKHD